MTEITNTGLKGFETLKLKELLRKSSYIIFDDFEVDANQGFNQLKKLGVYDFIDPNLNEKNFSIANKTNRNVKAGILNFGKTVTYAESVSVLEKLFLSSMVTEEILTLGIKYPDLQRQHSIVALGSYFEDFHQQFRIPLLSSDGPRRKAGTVARHGEFHQGFWFGVIFKIV